MREFKDNKFTPAGIIQFAGLGDYYKRSKWTGYPCQVVYFSSNFGRIVFYDDESKWQSPNGKRFHDDIMDAMEGKNSGYFAGLNYSVRNNGDYFIAVTPNYSVLSKEQVETLVK